MTLRTESTRRRCGAAAVLTALTLALPSSATPRTDSAVARGDAIYDATQLGSSEGSQSTHPSTRHTLDPTVRVAADQLASPCLEGDDCTSDPEATVGAEDESEPVVDDEKVKPLGLPTGDAKSGVTSQAISMPKGEGSIQGMEESFSAQLSTGVASFSVPIVLPAARGGAQPQLKLSYSSAGGFDVAGVGWSTGTPFIARQTDRGIPRYDDREQYHPGQDRFAFNGGQELVPICNVGETGACVDSDGQPVTLPDQEVMPDWAAGWMYFRPRVEGSFTRFFWSPDHHTWRVQRKSGVTMEFGVPRDGTAYAGALEQNSDSAQPELYRWYLVRMFDTFGSQESDGDPLPRNVVHYRYDLDGGRAYLTDIYDTSPANNPVGATLESFAHHTRLRYEPRPDPTVSYRSGWRIEQNRRLLGIDVASKTFNGGTGGDRALVRRYHLAYDDRYHASILQSVQLEGRCAGTENAAPIEESGEFGDTNCPRLPPMLFGYSHVSEESQPGGYEAFDTTIVDVVGSPKHSLDEDLTDLFDVNSDGLPDVLVTAPGIYGDGHAAFINGDGGVSGSFGSTRPVTVDGVLGADAGTITLRNTNVVPLDVDGDGHVNLLHMPKSQTYALYSFEPDDKDGFRLVGRELETASRDDVKIDFTSKSRFTKSVDVNFDGLVDILVSTGTEMQAFLSLGRYPGGDGQFGHAWYDDDGALHLSNDPIVNCLPWSAAPVSLGDKDVRLADMNGDGVVDLVRVRPGQALYWPGRGNGYFGTGDRKDCGEFGYAQDRHIVMESAPFYSHSDGSALRVGDVNGDGLADMIQVRFDAVDIWLNVDGEAWMERRVIARTPVSQGLNSRVRIVDVNGSGTRDILWGNGRGYRYIDLQGGKRVRLLTRVDNGYGKSSVLEYESSTEQMMRAERGEDRIGRAWDSKMPLVTQVVVRHIERDNLGKVFGLPARDYVTEYTYRDPIYDGQQREFRGFRYAESKRVGDSNSPSNFTASTFLLGECVDETPDDGVDACSVSERWRDNPREALKGLPVLVESFDEQGVYDNTAHTGYRLRRLYSGLDDRDVRHAFLEAATTYLYDTAAFDPTLEDEDVQTTIQVELDDGDVEVGTGPEDTLTIPVRASGGAAKLQMETRSDWFGNQIAVINHGCVGGDACKRKDERITERAVPKLLSSPGHWMWSTARTWISGQANKGPGHGRGRETLTTYDRFGAPVTVRAVLGGTEELYRARRTSSGESISSPGLDVASRPADASNDGTIVVSRMTYDKFGNVRVHRGANKRCTKTRYDPHYKLFVTSETSLPGGCGGLTGPSSSPDSGAIELTTAAVYDYGLAAPTLVVDMQGQVSRVYYDGFGRLVALYRPHPGRRHDPSEPVSDPLDPGSTATEGVCALPSVTIEYRMPDAEVGRNYSTIHTAVQDGQSCGQTGDGDDGYRHSHAFVDGFGRTLVTLTEADEDADGHPWVARAVVEYDAKGAVRRKYLPFYFDETPSAFDFEEEPPAQYGSQRYDAFGRAAQTYDIDGTVTLTTRFHALSTDLWDAADMGPGPHVGSYASSTDDGHGRPVLTTERFHVGGQLEKRHVRTAYLPTGDVSSIERIRGNARSGEKVVRWMRYDSLGRMVVNAEPNTSLRFSANPDTAQDMKTWRYAYNDAGDLVGTSDARGCGVNFTYDGTGRLTSEDYSPCEPHHEIYSPPGSDAGGREVFYQYDSPVPPEGHDAPPGLDTASAQLFVGQLVSLWDRGSVRYTSFDARARATRIHMRIAKPAEVGGVMDPNNRYADRWYTREMRYDAADREIWATTGAQHEELLAASVPPPGPNGSAFQINSASAVTTSYTSRGKVRRAAGSYGDLITRIERTADDRVTRITYGDIAGTTTALGYDTRRRIMTVQTYRGPPSEWAQADSYQPRPVFNDDAEGNTLQLLLQDRELHYDAVNNPTEIIDYRNPDEWPRGAKPVTRRMEYDDLYRVERVDYSYPDGSDEWESPFDAEMGDQSHDPRRAHPAPHSAFDQRLLWQSYQYDWLGNNIVTQDDAGGFYDRSLGQVEQATAEPYRISRAAKPSSEASNWLQVQYDLAGNMRSMSVSRGGACLGSVCNQHFAYQWDEVGRLSRARRWDVDANGARSYAEASARGEVVEEYANAAAVDLRYSYDGTDRRVLKTAVDSDDASHTVYVFPTLELRRARFLAAGAAPPDFERSALTEVAYLFASGVRLARVVFEPRGDVPSIDPEFEPQWGRGSKLHVFFELGDHLGSSTLVLDQQTSELVEATTYQAYGATESDYRPDRWANFRADYKFTGKEEDVEVGLQYFGKRYLNPLLGRWISPDPLSVHAPGAADLNVYAYVSGQVLKATDPVGLNGEEAQAPVAIGTSVGGGTLMSDGSSTDSDNPFKQAAVVGASADAIANAYVWNPDVVGQSTPKARAQLDFKRGVKIDKMAGNNLGRYAKDADKVTSRAVVQVKSTSQSKPQRVAAVTRKATRDAARFVRDNPTVAGARGAQAEVVVPNSASRSVTNSAKTAVQTARKPINGAMNPKVVRGLPGGTGVLLKSVSVVGGVASAVSLVDSVERGDVNGMIRDGSGTASSALLLGGKGLAAVGGSTATAGLLTTGAAVTGSFALGYVAGEALGEYVIPDSWQVTYGGWIVNGLGAVGVDLM